MAITSFCLRGTVAPLVFVGSFFVCTLTALALSPTSVGGPGDTQINVPPDASIDREFDTSLSGATVNTNTVLLKANAGNTMTGAVTGGNLCTQLNIFTTSIPKQMIACQHAVLAGSTWFTATFTTGIKTSTGVALGANSIYRFKTSSFAGGGNFVPPAMIRSTVPTAGTSQFAINSKIRVYFRPGGSGTGTTMATAGTGSVLSPTNIQLFAATSGQPTGGNLLACANTSNDCNLSWNATNNELIITPGKKAPVGSVASTGGSSMTSGTAYILVVKGGFQSVIGVKNTDNSPLGLSGGQSSFMVPFTASATDATAPAVKGSFPQDAATGVNRAIYNINIGFSESVDPATITTSNVKLFQDGGNGTYNSGGADDTLITGTSVDYFSDEGTAYLSPNAILASNTKHFVVVTTGVKDLAGNPFAADKILEFTTTTTVNGQASDTTLPTVVSATANNFAISVAFSEPMKFNVAANQVQTTSIDPFDANNINNWRVESPPGVAVNMTGKSIRYIPGKLTVEIGSLTLPPNQDFKVKVATNTGAVRIKDLSNNLVDTAGSPPGNAAQGQVKSVMDTGGQGGANFDFASNQQNRTEVLPVTPLAGATAVYYRIQITTSKSVPTGGSFNFSFPTGFSFGGTCTTAVTGPDNADINGPAAGTVTIATVACSSTSRIVTVTTGGAATGTGNLVRFTIQGINNSPVPKDPTTPGYSVDVSLKDPSGSILDSKTAMPFFLSQAGSQSILGTVFKDNGVGGGTANNGVQDGSELGVQNMKVCASGYQGSTCVATSSTGAYVISSLSNGFYKVVLPPTASGSFIAATSQQDVNLAGGASKNNVNFALTVSTTSIVVSLSGIPANTNLNVFAFDPNGRGGGGNVRTVTYAGATATATLPAPPGTYFVGVGPQMNSDPSLGGSTIPVATFISPPPQQVVVTAGNAAVSIALQSASNSIKGKVVNNEGTGISNAFVVARTQTSAQGGEGQAQSGSGGVFSIPSTTGNYTLQAFMPGMPPSAPIPVEVKANVSNADNNATADVYVNGVLITNAGGTSVVNLRLIISQGGLTISGKVMDESGNPIPYANVRAQLRNGGSFGGRFVSAPANSAGSYTVYVEAGTWDIGAFAPGYGQLPTTAVTITTTSATQNMQASTASFGSITGTVKQNGTGVVGAFVNVYGTSGGNQAVTGSGGVYTLKVQAGTYTIEGNVPGSGPTTKLTSVVVAGSDALTGKNLTLGQAGTLSVTIDGVTDAFVEARDSSGQGNGTNVNTSGVYQINLPAGTYTLKANSPRLGQIGSQSVTITGGATTTATFTPATTFNVTGLISSSSSTCVNGVGVAFADASNGRVIIASASSTGSYLVKLPNGTYRISAGKAGCIDSAAPSLITVNGAAVSTGGNRTMTATDQTITGRVTLSGVPVTLATKVIGRSSDNTYVFTDVSSGSYTLNVTAGTWAVFARSEGYTSTETSVAAGGTANLALTAISGYTRQEPQSTQITPTAGGIVKNASIGSNFSVNLPKNALSSTDSNAATITSNPTTAFVSQTTTAQVVGISAVEITPVDSVGVAISTLGANATITLPYLDADITAAGLTDASKLVVSTWNDSTGNWDSLSTTVDTVNKVLTASTSHFSTFAVVAPTGGGTTTSSTTTSTSSGGGGGGGGGSRDSTRKALGLLPRDLNGKVQWEKTDLKPAAVFTKQMLESVRSLLKMRIGGKFIVFRDVPVKEWYASSVATMIEAGIASGYRDTQGNLTGEFGPTNSITYAELAKMAFESARASTVGVAVPKNRFAHGHWSAPYIGLAEAQNLSVYGTKNNITLPATRGAVIQTLVEVLQIIRPAPAAAPVVLKGGTGALTASGTVVSGSGGSVRTGSGVLTGSGKLKTASGDRVITVTPIKLKDIRFTDVPDTADYAQAINLAAALGIVNGDTDKQGNPTGKFRPNASINRAEVARIFAKLMELDYVR